MKTFVFPFETIKNASIQKLKIVEAKLHKVMLDISSKNRDFQSYLNALNKTKMELKGILMGKMEIEKINLYSIIISNTEKILVNVLSEIRKLEEEKETIIEEYMKLNNQKKALEKLRNKLWSKYMMEYTKYENLEVSDNMYFKKASK